jgi:hypothetical protein
MKNKFSIAMSLAMIVAMLVTSFALAAELLTAELTGTANDVTVTQGTGTLFTIRVSASGSVACTQTAASPSTATVDTVYAISAGGTLSSNTPSGPLSFFAATPCSGTNGSVTWTGAPAAYSVSASVSAAATTPVGAYTITLSSPAGTTDETNPNTTGGKLEDTIATSITVHVVAPVVTDSTPPDTSITANPANPTSSTSASFSFTGTDDVTPSASLTFECKLDGGAFATCTSSKSYSGLSEGSHTFQVRAKDAANNFDATPASFTWIVDTVAPSVTVTPDRAPDHNGWYNAAVVFDTNGTDANGIASCTADQTYTGPDGIGLTVSGSCTDNAGNTAGGTSTAFKFDNTDPSVTVTPDRAPDHNGWYNAAVVFDTDGTDANGIESCDADQTYTGPDGTGLTVSGSCTDNAGNTAGGTSAAFKFDNTDPSVTVTPDRAPDHNGWYNAAVVFDTDGTDANGIASCDADQTYTGPDGTGLTVSGSCTDNAGNTAGGTSAAFKFDATAPTISGLASPAANLAGWNNSDVTVSFTCNDNLSGVASCGPNQTLSSDGAGQSATGNVTDNAGNTASATVSGLNIDKTAPVFGSCPAGGPFLLNSGLQSVGPISADAAISGLNALASTLSGSVDTSSIGLKTVNFTAVDNADNSATTGCSYSVIYNWSGFFQPIDNLPVLNKAKAGSAIPVKFSLSGNQGLNIFTAGYPVSTVTACGTTTTDVIESTVTAGSSSLSYDALADQYVYVWKTEKTWTGCRTLTVKLADGTIHQANFNFVK